MLMTRLMSSLHLSLLLPSQLTCGEVSPLSPEVRALCLIWPLSCPITDFSTAKSLHSAHHLLPLGTGFPCLVFDAEPSITNKFLPPLCQ